MLSPVLDFDSPGFLRLLLEQRSIILPDRTLLRATGQGEKTKAVVQLDSTVAPMRVFAISGLSGTGKTTLLEQLIRELVRRGYSVATLKSTQEDVLESEETDTWRHQRAGAKTTVLLGPQNTTIRHGRRMTLREIFADSDFDFLLVEGMKRSNIPKCWCLGRKKLELKQLPPETIAAITWDQPASTAAIPVIKDSELSTLADIIEKHAAKLDRIAA